MYLGSQWVVPVLLSWLGCVSGSTQFLGDDPDDHNVTVLRILVLLPHERGGYNFPFGAEMAGAAILSAFEQIKSERLLPGISFKADFADSGCNGVVGIGKAHEMLGTREYSAIIGPQCSQVCSQVARLATFLNVPCFSGVCQDVEMNDKTEFKTLTRLLGTFEMTGFAVSQILSHFGWQRVSILAERQTDIIWLLTLKGLEFAFAEANVTIAQSQLLFQNTDLEDALLKAAKVSRVIILGMGAGPFREMMRLATRHNLLNGDYIFLAITYYKQKRIFGDYNWQQGDDDDDVIKMAYKSVFFISYYNRDQLENYQLFLESVKRGSKLHFGYEYVENEEVPYPAANLYEATHLYAVALNETIRDQGDITDGQHVAQRLWGRSFNSVTGGVSLNANGDREQAYMIHHQQDDVIGDVQLIGSYFSANKSLEIFPEHVTWPGGRVAPPSDTPSCGFDGEFCREDAAARLQRVIGIFSGSFAGVLVLCGITFFFIYRKLKWDKEISNMNWKYKLSDVIMKNSKGENYQGSVFGRLSVLSLKSSVSYSSQFSKMNLVYTNTAYFKGMTVTVKPINHISHVNLSDKSFLQEMKQLHDLSHTNLAKIWGATVEVPDVYLITEYCSKGSLQDLLENDDVDLDLVFKYSLMNDILNGLAYLHMSFRNCHGNLKSSNCVIDSRFVVKLTDFGPTHWILKPFVSPNALLWTPPELLIEGNGGRIRTRSPQADVYALGIILHEIIYREGPFYQLDSYYETEEIIQRVRIRETPAFRPYLHTASCAARLYTLIQQCWRDEPTERPQISEALHVMKSVFGERFKSGSLLDNILQRMEHYAQNLEKMVCDRTSKYVEEKKRAEDLLDRLLPRSIAMDLQTKGFVLPKTFDCVTVYFSDIVGFTDLCSKSSPMQVVTMLNDLYTMCDEIIAKYDVYKVETIGDAYMAVSGLPQENGDNHVIEIANMALALRASVNKFTIRHCSERHLLLRIGVHSGPCVAGVVGLTMPRYCLFGDTVNTASRMESTGEALKIHMSQETTALLELKGGFETSYRGKTNIKGKGELSTYWLEAGPEQDSQSENAEIFKSPLCQDGM